MKARLQDCLAAVRCMDPLPPISPPLSQLQVAVALLCSCPPLIPLHPCTRPLLPPAAAPDVVGNSTFRFNVSNDLPWWPAANKTRTQLTLDLTDNQDGTLAYSLFLTGGREAHALRAGRWVAGRRRLR